MATPLVRALAGREAGYGAGGSPSNCAELHLPFVVPRAIASRSGCARACAHVARATRAGTRTARLGLADPRPFNAGPQVVTSNAYGRVASPNALGYSGHVQQAPLLAIGDQSGFLSILNTRARLPAGLSEECSADIDAQWAAHECSINQLLWARVSVARHPGPPAGV